MIIHREIWKWRGNVISVRTDKQRDITSLFAE